MEEKRGFCSFILGILSDLAIYINKFFNYNIVIANNSGFSNLLQGSLRYVQLRWRESKKKYIESIYCLMMLLLPDVCYWNCRCLWTNSRSNHLARKWKHCTIYQDQKETGRASRQKYLYT